MTTYDLKTSLKNLTEEQENLIKNVVKKTQRYYKEDSFYLLSKERKRKKEKNYEFLNLENLIKEYLINKLYIGEKNKNIIKSVSKVGEHFIFYKNNENNPYLENHIDDLIEVNSIGISLSNDYIKTIEEYKNKKEKIEKYLEWKAGEIDSFLFNKFEFNLMHFIRLKSHFYRQRGNLKRIKWKKSIKTNIDYDVWHEGFNDINSSAADSLKLFFEYKERMEKLKITFSDLVDNHTLRKDLDYTINCYFDLINLLLERYEITKKEKFLNKSFKLEQKCLSLVELSKDIYEKEDCTHYLMYQNTGDIFIKKRKRAITKKEKENYNSIALEYYLKAYNCLKENYAFLGSTRIIELNKKITKCKSFGKKEKNRLYKKPKENEMFIKIKKKHKVRKRKFRKNKTKLIDMC